MQVVAGFAYTNLYRSSCSSKKSLCSGSSGVCRCCCVERRARRPCLAVTRLLPCGVAAHLLVHDVDCTSMPVLVAEYLRGGARDLASLPPGF